MSSQRNGNVAKPSTTSSTHNNSNPETNKKKFSVNNKIIPGVPFISATDNAVEKMDRESSSTTIKEDDVYPSGNMITLPLMTHLTPGEYNRRKSLNVLEQNINNRNSSRRTTVQIFREWMMPSETPVNLKIFGGSRAVKEEQIRWRNAGWIIHPFSSLRYYWDLSIMVLLAFNMVILPLNIAFFYDESLVSWMVFHTISDIFFVTDIVLNFRTGYLEDKNGYRMKFVLDTKLIARRYMRSWLLLDVISSFPIDNVLLVINGGDSESFGLGLKSASRAFKFMRLAKLLSLLKLLRLSRILRYISKYEDFYHLTASVMRYIKLVLMMLLVAHWNGCMGFLIPMLQEFPRDSWVSLNQLEHSHWTEQYGWALFKALSHMLCIGYGRFIPQLLSEALFTIFSMITGATFYALFIAHSMAYIQQSDSARRQYQEKFQQIEEYMSYRHLPQNIREKITDYYEHKYSQKRLFDEQEILYEVSQPIRDEIVNHNCRDLIESVPFLLEGGPDFITLIVNNLTFDVFLPGDIIIKEDSYGKDMFFIRSGSVDIIAEGQFITTLSEGDYFGEITMLTDSRRVASVRAATVCDLFILSKDILYDILKQFPERRLEMEKVALSRLHRLRNRFPRFHQENSFSNVSMQRSDTGKELFNISMQFNEKKFPTATVTPDAPTGMTPTFAVTPAVTVTSDSSHNAISQTSGEDGERRNSTDSNRSNRSYGRNKHIEI